MESMEQRCSERRRDNQKGKETKKRAESGREIMRGGESKSNLKSKMVKKYENVNICLFVKSQFHSNKR